MMGFNFKGEIPASKSVLNRALIVQSYFSGLQLSGDSKCDDVIHMREGLRDLEQNKSLLNCGEGGTTFRFLALRASRLPGKYTLVGTKRLFERPLQGLTKLLFQLGVRPEVHETQMLISGQGWKKPDQPIVVDTSESSQYASALLLNSWMLDFDLDFELQGAAVSESYFLLTVAMMKKLGMQIENSGHHYFIPKMQSLSGSQFSVEADVSSAFTMAALGALVGPVEIENFDFKSSQPDIAFLDIFKRMNINWSTLGNSLLVTPSQELKSVKVDIGLCPDLFPVLAVLCSWASGVSQIFGAPQLAHKESNRIESVSRLLTALKIKHEKQTDGMIIYGSPNQELQGPLTFNPDQDHRLVMAATIMKLKGHNLQIEEPQAINKSFPEFLEYAGLTT